MSLHSSQRKAVAEIASKKMKTTAATRNRTVRKDFGSCCGDDWGKE